MAEIARFATAPCPCVRDHTPRPEYTELHHTHPKSEQIAVWGEVRDRETVPLCPSSHRAVHVAIAATLAGRKSPPMNTYARSVAIEGVRRIRAARAGG